MAGRSRPGGRNGPGNGMMMCVRSEIGPCVRIDRRMGPVRIATNVIVVPVTVLVAKSVHDQPESGRAASDAQSDRNADPVAVPAPIVTVHDVFQPVAAAAGQFQTEQQVARCISSAKIVTQIRARHSVLACHLDDETVGVGSRVIVDHKAESVKVVVDVLEIFVIKTVVKIFVPLSRSGQPEPQSAKENCHAFHIASGFVRAISCFGVPSDRTPDIAIFGAMAGDCRPGVFRLSSSAGREDPHRFAPGTRKNIVAFL